MAKQRIDGDHNVQVGRIDGDLTIGPDDPLDPGNPNLIECPSCWKLASRFATPCPRCGYNIRAHFAAIELEERRKQALRKAGVCAAFFVVSGLLTSMSWFPESLKGPFAVASLIAVLLGAAFLSAADKNK